MNTHTFRNVLTGAIAASLMTGATAVHASFVDEVYHTDFSGYSDGDIPTDWVVAINDGWGIEASDEQYAIRTGDIEEPAEGITFYDGLLNDGSSAHDLTDYRVVVPIARSTRAQAGITMRYQDEDNYYHGRRRGDHLQIFRAVDGLEPDPIAELTDEDFPNGGVLDMTVQGSQITLNYYDELGGDLLGSISATDSALTSGTFGARSRGSTNRDFLMTSVTAYVPEPGSLALLGAGAGLMFIRRRR